MFAGFIFDVAQIIARTTLHSPRATQVIKMTRSDEHMALTRLLACCMIKTRAGAGQIVSACHLHAAFFGRRRKLIPDVSLVTGPTAQQSSSSMRHAKGLMVFVQTFDRDAARPATVIYSAAPISDR